MLEVHDPINYFINPYPGVRVNVVKLETDVVGIEDFMKAKENFNFHWVEFIRGEVQNGVLYFA